jgi:hypothetical protein
MDITGLFLNILLTLEKKTQIRPRNPHLWGKPGKIGPLYYITKIAIPEY